MTGELGEGEEDEGNNSEDEYSHVGQNLTEEEWREKDARFERNMRRKGYVIKKMGEDGACLFRAVADQLYGDEEMHQGVRTQCMDYIVSHSVHLVTNVLMRIFSGGKCRLLLTVHDGKF